MTTYPITCLSILALVFGQIESAKDFNVKAKEFHACGLELSHLYNELRIFKTLKLNPTPLEQVEFARKALESQFNGIWSGITKTYGVAYKTDFQSTGSA